MVREILRDYLLYAPLGAAVVAVEEIPRFAEHYGRLERQVNAAGLIGRFAVAEAVRRFSATPSARPGGVAARPEHAVPLSPPAPGDTGPTTVPPSAREPGVGPVGGSHKVTRSRRSDGNTAPQAAATAAPTHDLPIPAYDTLAASQVVERLASLTPPELEAVRRHEAATRRRRTVLHRIAQLNAEHDGSV